jgi:hypothetical protein
VLPVGSRLVSLLEATSGFATVQLALECADPAAISKAVSAAEAMHLQTPLLAEACAMRAHIAAAESTLRKALRQMDDVVVGTEMEREALVELELRLDECRALQSASAEVASQAHSKNTLTRNNFVLHSQASPLASPLLAPNAAYANAALTRSCTRHCTHWLRLH